MNHGKRIVKLPLIAKRMNSPRQYVGGLVRIQYRFQIGSHFNTIESVKERKELRTVVGELTLQGTVTHDGCHERSQCLACVLVIADGMPAQGELRTKLKPLSRFVDLTGKYLHFVKNNWNGRSESAIACCICRLKLNSAQNASSAVERIRQQSARRQHPLEINTVGQRRPNNTLLDIERNILLANVISNQSQSNFEIAGL